jgi:hypothetical protein
MNCKRCQRVISSESSLKTGVCGMCHGFPIKTEVVSKCLYGHAYINSQRMFCTQIVKRPHGFEPCGQELKKL